MNTLYDLVKRIDALTANSQQVLNALIRSCLATGSSSGYKVKKFTQTIEMTRADIYRLYDFYNTWEQAGFPDDDTFDRLLDKADTRWHRSSKDGTQLATDAVVKHSKILYMDSANQSQTDDSYWVEKIKTSASGKAVVSTAPIPINLRTPLYDENLSVKSFSQYETYLFPIGYRRTEILGTPNNGEDYVAGGQNWEYDVTDFFRLNASHITMGHVTGTSPKDANYGDSYYTFSWGDESYAFGTRSLAMGNHAVALGNKSAAIGDLTVSYGESSLATGVNTYAVGTSSVTFNSMTTAGAPDSLAANSRTVTGGHPYNFTVRSVDPATVDGKVVCVGEGSTTGECYLADVGATTELANLNVLHVSLSTIEQYMPEFDLKVDDYVQIYDIYGMIDGTKKYPFNDKAYAYPKFNARIVQIANTAPNEYDITLDKNLPANPLMMPAGGRIQTYIRNAVNLGYMSAAFNHYTLARGEMQTVVGTSNLPDDEARFIVGTGSKELSSKNKDSETGDTRARANGMAVARKYGYMKLYNGEAGISVSDTDRNIDDYHLYPGAVLRGGSSTNNHSRIAATEKQGLMLSRYNGNEVARVGTAVQDGSYSNKGVVTAIFSSLQGTAVISSGSYITQTTGEQLNLIDTLLAQSKIIDGTDNFHDVAMYSEDGIEIRSVGTGKHSIHIWANSYLTQTFHGLILEGDTFGALTATDKAKSFILAQRSGGQGNTGHVDDIMWGESTGCSGFYYGITNTSNFKLIGTDNWNTTGAHIFNSAIFTGTQFHSVTVSFPESLLATTTDNKIIELHPIVTSSSIGGIGNSNEKPTIAYSKELAYRDDVVRDTSMSYGKLAACGYASDTGTNIIFGADAMMPVAYFNSIWNYDSLYMVPFAVDSLSMCSGYSVFDTTENEIFRINDFRYITVGTSATITFSVQFMNDAWAVKNLCIPFMLGCGTTKTGDGYDFSIDAAFVHVTMPKFMKLAGRISKGATDTCEANNIDAVACSDGTIIVGLEPTVAFTKDKIYFVTLQGIVPFTVRGECCGLKANGEWESAMVQAVGQEQHLTYQLLNTFMVKMLYV